MGNKKAERVKKQEQRELWLSELFRELPPRLRLNFRLHCCTIYADMRVAGWRIPGERFQKTVVCFHFSCVRINVSPVQIHLYIFLTIATQEEQGIKISDMYSMMKNDLFNKEYLNKTAH